jgi:hypothetical protein
LVSVGYTDVGFVGYTDVGLQNVLGIFDHFSFFFRTNGTNVNTCGGITVHCVMWVVIIIIIIIMVRHIHRWWGTEQMAFRMWRVVVKILNKHLWLFSKGDRLAIWGGAG